MTENKQIEWKLSWKDECLKWICSFANAQGGLLEIGKNNKGKIMEKMTQKMIQKTHIKTFKKNKEAHL